MFRKPELHRQAVDLRRQGLSYSEILARVPIAQGTVSRWCRVVALSPEQRERIVKKQLDTPLIKGLMERAVRDEENARQWADREIRELEGQIRVERKVRVCKNIRMGCVG